MVLWRQSLLGDPRAKEALEVGQGSGTQVGQRGFEGTQTSAPCWKERSVHRNIQYIYWTFLTSTLSLLHEKNSFAGSVGAPIRPLAQRTFQDGLHQPGFSA